MQTEIFNAEEVTPQASSDAAPVPASTDITTMPPAARAAVALGSTATEKHLRELVKKASAIKTVVDVNGRAEAHGSYMALRTARTSITNTGKAAREDAQAFSTAVIQEEKRLIDITKTEEDRVKALRDKFDAEEEAKAEALRIKQAARKAELQGKVDAIRNLPLGMAESSAADVAAEIEELRQFVPDIEVFFEFADAAQDAANAAIVALIALRERHEAKEAAEAEQERHRVEAARIAKEKADREAAELAERQAAAARAEQELAERQRIIAEQQRVLDEQAAAIAKQRADADAALAKERAQFEAERQAFADQKAAAAIEEAERTRVANATKAQLEQKAASANIERQTAEIVGDHEMALAINARCYSEPLPGGQYYSRSTFKDNGWPILCEEGGKRSVFCDLVDENEIDEDIAHENELDSTVVGLPASVEVAPVVLAVDEAAPGADVTVETVVEAPTLRLGQIGARLGIILTEQFLVSLGFPAVTKERNSCLYHEADYPRICLALIAHIESKMVVEVAA